MEYRALGRTGVQVSELCLGCMMFGRRTGAEESYEIIDRALDAGINFLDTANVYARGQSEEFTGEALRRNGHRARIVNVSSAGQAPIDFDDVMLERGYDGVQAYCQSKVAQVMFTFDLAEELADRGVSATCLHPATFMPTKMVRAGGITPTSSLEEGVEATLRLVVDPELDGVTGRYFNGTRPAEPDPQASDADARRQLRELSDRLCGLITSATGEGR